MIIRWSSHCAGASVWLAKKYGASRVDAVEVNPAISGVLARWRSFAGDVYHQPGVRLFTEDARRHLADTTERYDLIELALALTGNVHTQPAGMEANLYTVEAVVACLRHLTPSGALVLIHSDPGNAYRQLRTVIESTSAALEELAKPDGENSWIFSSRPEDRDWGSRQQKLLASARAILRDNDAGEIATQEHFDRLELQRFLALWCVGHVTGSAAQLRGLMASGGTPG